MDIATRVRRTPRRRFSIVAFLMLLIGVLAITAGSAGATYPGKNGRIAFATDSGDSPQVIMTMKRDGTDMQRVVARALAPDWAPDGSTIVFDREHAGGPVFCSIEIARPGGGGIVDLTGGRHGCEADPSFTPDGRRILFTRNQRAIWRMNLTGGARTLVRRVPAPIFLDGGDPNVSPGGGTIAFVGTRSDDGLRALYTIRSDGSHLNRITSFGWALGSRIDWAPSGRHILFTEFRAGGPGNTAVIRPDGSGLVLLTHYSGDLGAGGAVYSPDGRWILYRHQNDAVGRYAIWKMRPDGSQRTRIRAMWVKVVTMDWGPQR